MGGLRVPELQDRFGAMKIPWSGRIVSPSLCLMIGSGDWDDMGEWTKLMAADGHALGAYVARPSSPVGAVIVVQEIFGVNGSIRSVADRYAEAGYLAIAPALFDRVERDVELTYEGEDLQKAFALMKQLDPNTALLDVAAAFEHVAAAGRVGVVGFCYGGLMSWLSSTRGASVGMNPACCAGYYPGGVGKFATEKPECPVMLHFGGDDSHIGQDQVEAVREAHPEVEIFIYPGAGHAFANAVRESYREEAATLAGQRTMQFFKEHLG